MFINLVVGLGIYRWYQPIVTIPSDDRVFGSEMEFIADCLRSGDICLGRSDTPQFYLKPGYQFLMGLMRYLTGPVLSLETREFMALFNILFVSLTFALIQLILVRDHLTRKTQSTERIIVFIVLWTSSAVLAESVFYGYSTFLSFGVISLVACAMKLLRAPEHSTVRSEMVTCGVYVTLSFLISLTAPVGLLYGICISLWMITMRLIVMMQLWRDGESVISVWKVLRPLVFVLVSAGLLSWVLHLVGVLAIIADGYKYSLDLNLSASTQLKEISTVISLLLQLTPVVYFAIAEWPLILIAMVLIAKEWGGNGFNLKTPSFFVGTLGVLSTIYLAIDNSGTRVVVGLVTLSVIVFVRQHSNARVQCHDQVPHNPFRFQLGVLISVLSLVFIFVDNTKLPRSTFALTLLALLYISLVLVDRFPFLPGETAKRFSVLGLLCISLILVRFLWTAELQKCEYSNRNELRDLVRDLDSVPNTTDRKVAVLNETIWTIDGAGNYAQERLGADLVANLGSQEFQLVAQLGWLLISERGTEELKNLFPSIQFAELSRQNVYQCSLAVNLYFQNEFHSINFLLRNTPLGKFVPGPIPTSWTPNLGRGGPQRPFKTPLTGVSVYSIESVKKKSELLPNASSKGESLILLTLNS